VGPLAFCWPWESLGLCRIELLTNLNSHCWFSLISSIPPTPNPKIGGSCHLQQANNVLCPWLRQQQQRRQATGSPKRRLQQPQRQQRHRHRCRPRPRRPRRHLPATTCRALPRPRKQQEGQQAPRRLQGRPTRTPTFTVACHRAQTMGLTWETTMTTTKTTTHCTSLAARRTPRPPLGRPRRRGTVLAKAVANTRRRSQGAVGSTTRSSLLRLRARAQQAECTHGAIALGPSRSRHLEPVAARVGTQEKEEKKRNTKIFKMVLLLLEAEKVT